MFGKKPKPAEMCKKWRGDMRKEGRSLDRSIRGIIKLNERKLN
jgi:hypothetical protein